MQLANEALITNASSVRANGTINPETIDMSAIGRAVYVNGNGGVDTMFGTDFADTMDGGTGADVMSGGNGRNAFVLDANNVDDTGTSDDERFTDSSTTAFDKITDFTLASASWTTTTANNEVTEFQALTIGGAGADILDINVGSALSVVADSNVTGVLNGILDIGSLNLADAIILADGVAATAGETLAFRVGDNTYVFTQNGANDVLVELTGLTGVAGLDLLGSSGTVGGANWIIIG